MKIDIDLEVLRRAAEVGRMSDEQIVKKFGLPEGTNTYTFKNGYLSSAIDLIVNSAEKQAKQRTRKQ